MEKKKTPYTEEWELYEKGKEYNCSIDLYDKVNTNERFFRGDQWDGISSGGLPTPVFNIFKRIINYFTSSIMQTPIKMRYTFSSPCGSDFGISEEEAAKASEKLNRIADARWEKSKMDDLIASSLTDAAVSGDAVCYTYWDESVRTGQKFKGDFVSTLIDGTNVFFGDPNSKNVQKQPYILIAQRETVEDLRAQAVKNGIPKEDVARILPDGERDKQAGDMGKHELENTKCISLIKLWKQDGRVYFRKSVKDTVIKGDTDTGLKFYPIAFYNWMPIKNCWHGQAVGTGLKDNQIFINKGFAMAMKHMMDTAFSKVVFDSTVVDGWSDRVGEAIAVNGPVENVAKVITPGAMQPGMLEVLNMAIEHTKEFMGATDTALGDVAPNNTSAILALQNASSVPLENVKRALYQFVEDIGVIWLDFMFAYYDDKRLVPVGSGYEEFGMSKFDSPEFACKIDVGASSYWSEISSLNTLDNLLRLGKITTAQYLKRLPDGLIPDKETLIAEVSAAESVILKAEGGIDE